MNIILTAAALALIALLLLIAWLLGQLPIFWKRLALALVAAWIGSEVAQFADMRNVSETVQTGLAIALALAALFCAFFLVQPLAWGIDDWLAERDTQNAEVQP